MESRLGKKEETKRKWAGKGFVIFILSSLCLLLYLNIPLIKFKVTLEMLTLRESEKNTEIYTIASKWVRMTSMI